MLPKDGSGSVENDPTRGRLYNRSNGLHGFRRVGPIRVPEATSEEVHDPISTNWRKNFKRIPGDSLGFVKSPDLQDTAAMWAMIVVFFDPARAAPIGKIGGICQVGIATNAPFRDKHWHDKKENEIKRPFSSLLAVTSRPRRTSRRSPLGRLLDGA